MSLHNFYPNPKPKIRLVILGAGLDTRAYRLESLRNFPIFEVGEWEGGLGIGGVGLQGFCATLKLL